MPAHCPKKSGERESGKEDCEGVPHHRMCVHAAAINRVVVFRFMSFIML